MCELRVIHSHTLARRRSSNRCGRDGFRDSVSSKAGGAITAGCLRCYDQAEKVPRVASRPAACAFVKLWFVTIACAGALSVHSMMRLRFNVLSIVCVSKVQALARFQLGTLLPLRESCLLCFSIDGSNPSDENSKLFGFRCFLRVRMSHLGLNPAQSHRKESTSMLLLIPGGMRNQWCGITSSAAFQASSRSCRVVAYMRGVLHAHRQHQRTRVFVSYTPHEQATCMHTCTQLCDWPIPVLHARCVL